MLPAASFIEPAAPATALPVASIVLVAALAAFPAIFLAPSVIVVVASATLLVAPPI